MRRSRLLLVAVLLPLLLLGALAAIASGWLFPRFEQIGEDARTFRMDAARQRLDDALQVRLNDLGVVSEDWSAWESMLSKRA